jgi:hypothetical protein
MAQGRFGLFGVNWPESVIDSGWMGRVPLLPVTGLLSHSAHVAIRPRKMTITQENVAEGGGAAQNPVTSWCQSNAGCDKKLCLHYETYEIHDFGSKSCSSWIRSSHMAR